jgi:glutamyl-tRNA synthetase
MTAYERARAAGGKLVLRIEDLYAAHCRMDYAEGIVEDLHWLGINWDEGPDVGGSCGPYVQSLRQSRYGEVWRLLHAKGLIYPSAHTRKDVERAQSAPHEGDGESIFPEALRPERVEHVDEPGGVNWRFRVPYGTAVRFVDNRAGPQEFEAGRDFGDFIVWCKNGWPSYELAVVVDDHDMRVTEVVRGEDLLLSTARQILLYHALGWMAPAFYHCGLVRDENGVRLAKRTDALSIAELRARGLTPGEVLAMAGGAA